MKFNRIIATLLTVCNFFTVSGLSNSISAYSKYYEREEIGYNGMFFRPTFPGSSALELIKYTGTDENIVIPEQLFDYTVTTIDRYVFKDNQNIKNVTLPDTIDYFDAEVFSNSSVVSVNIPESLHVIPSNMFKDCSNLETVIFHDNIQLISDTAFENTSVEIPPEFKDKVTDEYMRTSDVTRDLTDGEWTYNLSYGNMTAEITGYVGNNTEIVIPQYIDGLHVMSIVNSFKMPKNIKSISIPDNVRFSGLWIFGFAGSDLEEITLPSYINALDDGLFKNCKNLRKINFRGNPETFTIQNNTFSGCTSLDYIPYPESCTKVNIGKNAFENTGITDLKIDIDSTVGEYAFRNCLYLSDVELNNAVVNTRAFFECPSLEEATIKGNSKLNEASFYDCNRLKNINVEDLSTPMTNAVSICPDLMTINNKKLFDDTTGDFTPDMKDFVSRNFFGVDDVGFINMYVISQAEKIVSEVTNENMSDVQKIKAVHDWICENTVYDDGIGMDRKNHNDASVFMNDSTVCEGYARIANILFNTAGIESYYIESKNHAWNIVKAGNNYFHVDTTWDDGETVSHEWFLKSDEELRESGGSHAEWSADIPSSLHHFQKNILPECVYSMGDVNQDKRLSIADMVILKRNILNKNDIDYDGFVLADLTFDGVVDAFDMVRMREMIVKNNYTMGDVNQDNVINSEDMIKLNKYLLCQEEMDADGLSLADVNSDGVVDAFDLVRIRQLINN
ncbi:MAG: leucine-rich repeat protein [Ruminococcus sp.]|nr:leucine-rich repeat protein [Ruminococcus sp.]